MLRSIMTVGFWTLLSRVLGMVREILLFALIGAGPVLDAFVAAFRLPNMFRRFFAEGAFNAAFVPMLSKRLADDRDAVGFANQAMGGLAFVVMILTAVAMIFMPVLVWITASGFARDTRFDMTVDYGRVMFPYILFISSAALLSGALNAKGHFAVAAAAPVFLNILVIAALGLSWIMDGRHISYLIWSIPVAGVVQLAMVWVACHKAGLPITLSRPSLSPDMKQLIRIAVPAALANGVVQINLLVGQLVSSQYTGAVSWLYGADRLYQLPLGVVGIAVGLVLLPELSKRLQTHDDAGAKDAFNRGTEIALALTLPAAVALFVIPVPLASMLYEYGATGRDDVLAIGLATAIYGLGLPAFILQKLLQPLFFAREDTKTPFRFAVWSMIINAALALGLMPWLGWISAAVATTLSSWVMVALLAGSARKFGDVARISPTVKSRVLRMCIASGIMGATLWCVAMVVMDYAADAPSRIALALGLIALGIVVYGIAGRSLGAFDVQDLKSSLRRSR